MGLSGMGTFRGIGIVQLIIILKLPYLPYYDKHKSHSPIQLLDVQYLSHVHSLELMESKSFDYFMKHFQMNFACDVRDFIDGRLHFY